MDLSSEEDYIIICCASFIIVESITKTKRQKNVLLESGREVYSDKVKNHREWNYLLNDLLQWRMVSSSIFFISFMDLQIIFN